MKTKKNNPYKVERVSSEIERIVQEVITFEIKDHRVCGNATVSEVILTPDLSHCKIFVQILVENKQDVMDGLKKASGFIRHVIADTLAMRKVPEIVFILDDSLEKMNRIEEILKQINENEKKNNLT